MTKDELRLRLVNACISVQEAEQELTEIDARFGDADHGITMTRICSSIRSAAEESAGGIQAMLDDCATAVMMINGGSAVPLWSTWLDGLQESAPEGDEIDAAGLKAMFTDALDSLSALSKAKVGDKTMMDALIPATKAIADGGEEISVLFTQAAAAALQGAEDSKNYISKFGRARSYGADTLGTPDAGAVSMARFFAGLAKEV